MIGLGSMGRAMVTCGVALGVVVAAAPSLRAQGLPADAPRTEVSTPVVPDMPTVMAWPAPPALPALSPVGRRLLPQEARLPIVDDAGDPIAFDLILSRVDASGSKGGAWGFVLGAVGGLAFGAAIGKCGGVRGGYRYYCSPREEALQTALPVGLGFTLGFAFGWIGWNADRTTFDEALADIRQERRLAR